MKRSVFRGAAILMAMAAAACLIGSPTRAMGQNLDVDLSSLQREDNTYSAGNKTYDLFDTFVDNDWAIKEFSAKYSNFIADAQASGLPALSCSAASGYKAFALNNELELMPDDFGEIVSFLDILENSEENEELIAEIDLLTKRTDSGRMNDESTVDLLSQLLPREGGVSEFAEGVVPYNSGINLDAANAYAIKYATSPNAGKYGYEISWGQGADCTNFASQILYAGGIGMVSTGNVNTGWWWNSISSRSISWVRADTFAKYMGKGYSSRSWSTFKGNVRAGDFIGYDAANDGAIDHIGYVVDKIGGKLKIAQHSSDYLKWDTSTGWGSVGGNAVYYRIRR